MQHLPRHKTRATGDITLFKSTFYNVEWDIEDLSQSPIYLPAIIQQSETINTIK